MKKEKKKRQDVAEKNKALKRKKKAEKERIEEAELWERLKAVYKEFKKLTMLKKKAKKCQKLY